MKKLLHLGATALLGTLVALVAHAQSTPPDPTSPAGSGGLNNPAIAPKKENKPVPRLPDGKPDLTGVWQGGGPIGDISQGLMKGEEMVMLPEAQKIFESRKSADDPEANCLPTGVPRIAPYPWRIVLDPPDGKPTHMFFLFEGNIHSFRQIFLDGREHPDDLEASWYGHSVGHWEGDTLVVDTVGFNDRFWFDFVGHPHTTQLHTIERYTRTSYDTLENVTTIIDPGAYAKPFTIRFEAKLRPGWDLMEYICNENNQDVEHIQGSAGLRE
ncbi:MAG TPA: hypothetical protein VFV10_05985 [Gammaproteobacteria bacterium]|nr:hypothetical protein [Gammaproteobacteria bacterium]